MSERKKIRLHKEAPFWKERDRRKNDEDYDYQGLELPVAENGVAISTGVSPTLITENLRYRLQKAGFGEPQVIDHADIYQKAITSLADLLTHPSIPSTLKTEALTQLDSLTQALVDLFGNQVALKMDNLPNFAADFSGYQLGRTDNHRISVYQRLVPSYSMIVNRSIDPNCQIYIQEVRSRSSKGRAITDSDAKIRIGLRYPGVVANDCWNISIDSGLRANSGFDPDWRIIGPLSQAIYKAQTFPNFGYGINSDYTYHYADPTTKAEPPAQSRENLNSFNLALNAVFKQMVKR